MKTGGEKSKLTAADFDLRVRDRQLANGSIEPKTIERYLAELPDLEAQADTMAIEQPALGEGPAEPPVRTGPPAGST